MNGRTILAATAAVLAAAAATTSLAAVAQKDPKALALQLSDFPRGTLAVPGSEIHGTLATNYTASFAIRPGDIKREEDVQIEVWVAKTVATAKQIYQQTLATYTGKGPKIGPFAKAFKGEVALPLNGFGDEQFADYLPNPQRPHGQLIVRRGSVVWYLTVENCTPFASACQGTSRVEAPIGKSVALAELRKYGAKEKARVG